MSPVFTFLSWRWALIRFGPHLSAGRIFSPFGTRPVQMIPRTVLSLTGVSRGTVLIGFQTDFSAIYFLSSAYNFISARLVAS
jgi:hypothetical protein